MGAMNAMTTEFERARSDPHRLEAVRGTGLLDTPATAALDRLTRLAATLIDAPATFITLVDADRDFYLSNCGFGEPLATVRELRGTTFCHYALVHDGPLVIDDTRAHPVYHKVPTVQSLGVAAYMGVPMKSADGEVIGSFCAIDFKPRAWSPREREVMEELAAAAASEILLLQAIGAHVRRADAAQVEKLAAEQAAATRRDVLNAVSHDLRDPLNTIQMALGPLEAMSGDERVGRFAVIVRRQVARMSRLLEDLLDAARIDGGSLRLEPEPVNLAALVAEVAGDFAMQADAAGVTIRTDVQSNVPSIEGDRARLIQALSNLVSNSLKFTPRGGNVHVTARLVGDTVQLAVADTGCGIEAAQLPRVFDAFWQADAARRMGMGLGLHIVRGIVERHGGAIRVASAVGAGTTFEVDLPLAAH
jgi:signal transduction histidine kinase